MVGAASFSVQAASALLRVERVRRFHMSAFAGSVFAYLDAKLFFRRFHHFGLEVGVHSDFCSHGESQGALL